MKQPHQTTIASWYFGLQDQGISVAGLIPQRLPSLALLDLCLVEQVVPDALGIALMSFTESIAVVQAATGLSQKFSLITDRIDDPRKTWKLTPMDLESYDRWDDYTKDTRCSSKLMSPGLLTYHSIKRQKAGASEYH